MKMRCCWAFWRASIKGVPAKPVADVTARSSEARIKVLITILLCVAVAGCDDTMSALDPANTHRMGDAGLRGMCALARKRLELQTFNDLENEWIVRIERG